MFAIDRFEIFHIPTRNPISHVEVIFFDVDVSGKTLNTMREKYMLKLIPLFGYIGIFMCE